MVVSPDSNDSGHRCIGRNTYPNGLSSEVCRGMGAGFGFLLAHVSVKPRPVERTVCSLYISPHNIGTLAAQTSEQYRRLRVTKCTNLLWVDLISINRYPILPYVVILPEERPHIESVALPRKWLRHRIDIDAVFSKTARVFLRHYHFIPRKLLNLCRIVYPHAHVIASPKQKNPVELPIVHANADSQFIGWKNVLSISYEAATRAGKFLCMVRDRLIGSISLRYYHHSVPRSLDKQRCTPSTSKRLLKATFNT